MIDKRSEEDVAFGRIPCRFGTPDEPILRYMPTLKMDASKEWKALLAKTLGNTLAEYNVKGQGGTDSLASMIQLGLLAGDTITDLVVAYDASGSLGGREWLGAHADDAEVYGIFRACLDVHFPFVTDLLGVITALTGLMAEGPAVPSAPANSPSGPSPIGGSGRRSSNTPSTKRS